MDEVDVVVAGTGNAAFSAALSARQQGAEVLMLEKAPRAELGGNTYFTSGATRVAYRDKAELIPLMAGPAREQAADYEIDPYPAAAYIADMERVTDGRCDSRLTSVLAERSMPTLLWLRSLGMEFQFLVDRQSFEVHGKRRFWGNLTVGFAGGGKAMTRRYVELADAYGIRVQCGSPVTGLVRDPAGRTVGVQVEEKVVRARAVVLAAGGFEANPDLRAAYLGAEWRHAAVRGSPHNTGEILEMGLAVGAARAGDWASCHATPWDATANAYGDRDLTNQLTKLGYCLGVTVNASGRRFFDEGADYRNYTYARFGREILAQPGGVAYQIFDRRGFELTNHDEYKTGLPSHVTAHTIAGLADSLRAPALPATVAEFNQAVRPGIFNPARKDGKSTAGIEPPKSNWAMPLLEAPFHAFKVKCGITFTFGGLRIDSSARVLDEGGRPLPGLMAAGELVGGLFHGNYPGGAGLAAGAVFGRLAGRSASEFARSAGG